MKVEVYLGTLKAAVDKLYEKRDEIAKKTVVQIQSINSDDYLTINIRNDLKGLIDGKRNKVKRD